MTRLIDLIRFHYPHPQKAVGHTRERTMEAYCTGGACLLYAQDLGYSRARCQGRFPNRIALADVFQYFNPQLEHEQALRLAHNVIYYNDCGLFEEAWKQAAKALPPTIGDVIHDAD